jgi:S-adenosylmethionine:tRNA ribosyltransferase-isomerase
MAQYDYSLSDERIARFPIEPRDASRLLIYRSGQIQDKYFYQLPDYLPSGSLLVYNNTRVIHARLVFYKETAPDRNFLFVTAAPGDSAQNFQSTKSCEWFAWRQL